MTCERCHLSDVVNLLEVARSNLLEQADPLRDMSEANPGRLELHNAYNIVMRCYSRGCEPKSEYDAIMSLDYVRTFHIYQKGGKYERKI